MPSRLAEQEPDRIVPDADFVIASRTSPLAKNDPPVLARNDPPGVLSVARAAAALAINATTVSRRISTLEERVNARLFDHTPDGFALTNAGQDLLRRVERMEEEALSIEREVLGAGQRLSGSVRVTATEARR